MNTLQCIKVITMVGNADFTAIDESITLSGVSLRVCIDIPIYNDAIVEYDETVLVELSNTDESLVLSVATAEVVIVDDDGKFDC